MTEDGFFFSIFSKFYNMVYASQLISASCQDCFAGYRWSQTWQRALQAAKTANVSTM